MTEHNEAAMLIFAIVVNVGEKSRLDQLIVGLFTVILMEQMEQTHDFGAPWGTSLKVMTTISILIVLGMPVIGLIQGAREGSKMLPVIMSTPLVLLFIGIFFIIRGYHITADSIIIKRPGWNYTLNLTDLQSVEFDPLAMKSSIRTWGNGGLFCFAGYFRNSQLGAYRAFATDSRRSVILKFSKKTVVITPGEPEKFVATLKKIKKI